MIELPIQFPDPLAEAAQRAAEFQRLPTHERLRQLMDIIETARLIMRDSPHRVDSERLFRQREANWQRIQQELFARHGV
jgi:hypothetical protein